MTRAQRLVMLIGLLLIALTAPLLLGGCGGPRTRDTGDGGLATKASLSNPATIAVGPDGSLYIAESNSHRIRCVDTAGIITTVAGDGWEGRSGEGRHRGDGGLATKASLDQPRGLAVSASGELYIADTFNHRVRKVDREGVITTVAGSGPSGDDRGGYSGDGGPATLARLNCPYGIALDSDDSFYITDLANHCVRKVDAAGIITTIVGSGPTADNKGGYGGDGGPAAQARLNKPSGVALGHDGSLYIADILNHRVRKVDSAGIISTVAGHGATGEGLGQYAGDGGPATQASLNCPAGIVLAPDGSLYIADLRNDRVRKVDRHGIITTVAGTGQRDDSGDGGPAVDADLWAPEGLAVGVDGSLYIAELYGDRVRRIAPDGTISTFAGRGVPSARVRPGPLSDPPPSPRLR
jgi:sugar lactone lactonase YvrE